MEERNGSGFAFGIPLELKISAKGTDVTSLVIASSREKLEEFQNARKEKGIELQSTRELKTPEDLGELIKTAPEGSHSFGFSSWNCSWNPKGPKPNWVNPENPSKN